MKLFYPGVLALTLALAACGDDGGGDGNTPTPDGNTPTTDGNTPITPTAPTGVEMVASGGFTEPMDAVASPDGAMFYFSAHRTNAAGVEEAESTAAIFAVPSSGGAVETLVSGLPLEDPTGLLMSCDGSTLYIADMGQEADEAAAAEADENRATIYTLNLATKALTPLPAQGIGEAASLALATDCSTLYVSGYNLDGEPAVFSLPPEGGTATVIKAGAPLESPSGIYVDRNNIKWVMDHRPSNPLGGVLWAIDGAGETMQVADGLQTSEPAGVSLVAGGVIAVIPTKNEMGQGQLITVNTETMDATTVEAPSIIEPAGIRTAINAPVMVLVDADGDAIYRVE